MMPTKHIYALFRAARPLLRRKVVATSYDRATLNAPLARIQRLLQAARLEVEGLRPTDHVLRRAIVDDLDNLLRELREPSLPSAVSASATIARQETRGSR
jgi:hypothetical protein